jgi:hypothetical protein
MLQLLQLLLRTRTQISRRPLDGRLQTLCAANGMLRG